MRLLHTADWHLGKSFNEYPLLDDQAEFLDWLIAVLRDQKIDLLVLAGDIYDRTVPPESAVKLYSETIERINSLGIDVAAIAGNHDSAVRLTSLSHLHDGSYMISGGFTSAGRVDRRDYETGSIQIVHIPYLNPRAKPVTGSVAEIDWGVTHESVIDAAVRRANKSIDRSIPTVAMGHAFIQDCDPSDSEKTLSIGNSPLVAASMFSHDASGANGERDLYEYVALGHLHKPQLVGGSETFRYSGSPLSYSFSETTKKEVVIVEFDPNSVQGVHTPTTETLEIEVGRSAKIISGYFKDILENEAPSDDWVRVDLKDEHPIANARRQLANKFPHLLETRYTSRPKTENETITISELENLSLFETAEEFLKRLGTVKESHTAAIERALEILESENV